MKQQILTILLTLALIPCVSFAQDEAQQTTALDKLIKGYEVNQRVVEPVDQASEITRLKSQLIDVKVERDRLADEVLFLKAKLDNVSTTDEAHPECAEVECIPVSLVEQDKIITHVIYTVSQYRLAELITETVPTEYVEVHNMAQKIMVGAKNDLEVLGFDSTDMNQYPTLEEMLEQWNISQGSRATR